MNKLEQILRAARKDAGPEPPPGFDADVLRAIRADPPRQAETPSLFAQIDSWFPRLAFGAALVIVACVVADQMGSGFGRDTLTSGVTQLSDQWLFAVKGF